jgi:hypothetical protein
VDDKSDRYACSDGGQELCRDVRAISSLGFSVMFSSFEVFLEPTLSTSPVNVIAKFLLDARHDELRRLASWMTPRGTLEIDATDERLDVYARRTNLGLGLLEGLVLARREFEQGADNFVRWLLGARHLSPRRMMSSF